MPTSLDQAKSIPAYMAASRDLAPKSNTKVTKGKKMFAKLWLAALIVSGIGAFGSGAMAQQMPNCGGRPDFDACMQRFISGAQAANAQAQQQTFQTYLNEFGPMLRQQYPAYAHMMSFQQFAYQMMMSANGTNVQGAIDAQNRRFAGMQGANRTIQEGNRDYNAAIANNSNRTMAAIENWDRGAIRGTTMQINPYTGRPVELPYSNQAYNQPFSQGGQTYMITPQGYVAWNGYGWVQMRSAR